MMGGTFDRLHLAHQSLLKTAASIANEVFIGIVGDKLGEQLFAKKKFNELIEDYDTRALAVKRFILQFTSGYEIEELLDPWGPAPVDPRADVIVVSFETESSAHRINEMRAQAGLPLLDIVIIPWIYVDGAPISSTRLRAAEASQNESQ